MNEVIIRFLDVSEGKETDYIFDTRMSFRENFELLKDIGKDYTSYLVYEQEDGVFLDMNTPLEQFDIFDHVCLLLFAM